MVAKDENGTAKEGKWSERSTVIVPEDMSESEENQWRRSGKR